MLENLDLLFAVTILLMTLVTYFTRAGGLFVVSRLTPTPRVRAFLNHVPASILVAIIVPSLADKGPAEFISAAVTVAAAACTRNLLLSLLAGLLCVSALRAFVF